MAEGDEDKDADVSKTSAKRPLDHVPLKIIIKRHRPNSTATVQNVHSQGPATQNCSATVRRVRRRTPVLDQNHSPNKSTCNGVLPKQLLSKHAHLAQLMAAVESVKPKCLQEVWHTVQKRELEDDIKDNCEREMLLQRYMSLGTCDFGNDCEMPWLHPGIDVIFFENLSKEQPSIPCIKEVKKEESTELSTKLTENKSSNDEDVNISDWRFGPAQLWYDQLESIDYKNFTYGFKLKEQAEDYVKKAETFPDDAFLMVSQLQWENDVIWNGSVCSQEDLKKMKSNWMKVGGKSQPDGNSIGSHYSLNHRLPTYLQGPRGRSLFPNRQFVYKTPYCMQVPTSKEQNDDSVKPIIPFENEDLTLGLWEKEVIWDAESMPEIPKPKLPTLDPNDENVILGVPEDVFDIHQSWSTQQTNSCIKLSHPHVKTSKILIGKTGVKIITEDDHPQYSFNDPFNVSNDSYYAIKSLDTSLRLKPIGKIIQHSTPAVELRPPFIPTHLSVVRLQNFHRPPLKRYSHGRLANPIYHPVYSLSKEISSKAQAREEERQASGGGDVFFMREPDDLSGRDGDLVLLEFSEEHPLIMNEVGMCSKIINYYKRKASKDQGPPQHKYGDVVYPHTTPFLGTLSPGQCVQAVENNLFRCPIFEHKIRETDFLVIRTRHSFSIREVDALFVAGQQCPLYEVPAPNSRCATNFTRDFLQLHIFRMFLNCPDRPQWVKMEEIKRAFPEINDLNIRKCLKLCSDFKRVDFLDSNCWVLRPDFRLPTEEELRNMVTPEQCCAQFSMLAALQRLKEAGYGGNMLFVPPDEEDDDEEGLQLKIDDEVKAAPWNLTRGFIQSMNGKCLLDVTGMADPTGCGEGFSYLTRSNKPKKQFVVEDPTTIEREKPSVTNAKILLKKMGVPDKEIKRLSPWELIEIARTASKKKGRGRGRVAKGPKVRPMTTAEHVAKYKEECQRIFDLQNQTLQSNEELSSDEDNMSDEDGSDVEEMGKVLEKLLSNGRTFSEVRSENEEKEREELVKMMMDENAPKQSSKDKKKKHEAKSSICGHQPDRVLKINRTFRDPSGKEYTRVEFVRKSSVIDIYLKMRATKDEAFISQFAALESSEKQKMLREKRYIEDQLRKIKQREQILGQKQLSNKIASEPVTDMKLNDENLAQGVESTSKAFISPPNKKSVNTNIDPKRRCGACGNPGHKRGNKACPQYFGPMNVAMTEEEEEEYQRKMNVDDQNLINVDGTKLKISVKLIKRAEEMKKKTLVIRVPKDIVRKRKRSLIDQHCDYLEKYQRPVNRRRVDPLILLSNAFEAILNEMRDMPDSDPFHFPVNAKVLPHYYTVISRPMDLQTIRENIRQRKYKSRKDFLEDVHQIVQNSTTFNGPDSPFTVNAGKMLNLCVKRMGQQEEELIRLEETTNPDEDDDKEEISLPQNINNPTASAACGSEPLPKAMVDLSMSDTEDEAELGAEYLDARACSVVP
ncbi:Transcription initiation factor TFIID subunit 1 [Frankliniella fusca]|uniref:Transcription initiation factor TFIID subunit 1 n=1 Tax=Frankliniella fusca TaxID=407009 RepID=A0AAE1H545_9NEOP|nr:Transcription initiation factor TFIID subunit 1 [Frankliniella fusca]